MIAEPVRVPTSGISEKKKATTARTAGNGAPMIVQEDRAQNTVDDAHRDLTHDEVPDGLRDLLGDVDEPRALGGRHQLVDGRLQVRCGGGEVDREDQHDERTGQTREHRRSDGEHALPDGRVVEILDPVLHEGEDLVDVQVREDAGEPLLEVLEGRPALDELGDRLDELTDLAGDDGNEHQHDAGERARALPGS